MKLFKKLFARFTKVEEKPYVKLFDGDLTEKLDTEKILDAELFLYIINYDSETKNLKMLASNTDGRKKVPEA